MLQSLKKSGFTLIELLVVITIIGILATGATTVYTSQIQKARDTTRVNDIKALQSAVEQFYQDGSVYPQGAAQWTLGASTLVLDYAPTLAQDPKHNQTCNASRCGYVYTVGADGVGITQGAYELSMAFENEANRTTKAIDTSDNGNDVNRFEVGAGSPAAAFNTASVVGTAFADSNITSAADTTATVLVKKSAIATK